MGLHSNAKYTVSDIDEYPLYLGCFHAGRQSERIPRPNTPACFGIQAQRRWPISNWHSSVDGYSAVSQV